VTSLPFYLFVVVAFYIFGIWTLLVVVVGWKKLDLTSTTWTPNKEAITCYGYASMDAIIAMEVDGTAMIEAGKDVLNDAAARFARVAEQVVPQNSQTQSGIDHHGHPYHTGHF
jgi:hypothetical protein